MDVNVNSLLRLTVNHSFPLSMCFVSVTKRLGASIPHSQPSVQRNVWFLFPYWFNLFHGPISCSRKNVDLLQPSVSAFIIAWNWTTDGPTAFQVAKVCFVPSIFIFLGAWHFAFLPHLPTLLLHFLLLCFLPFVYMLVRLLGLPSFQSLAFRFLISGPPLFSFAVLSYWLRFLNPCCFSFFNLPILIRCVNMSFSLRIFFPLPLLSPFSSGPLFRSEPLLLSSFVNDPLHVLPFPIVLLLDLPQTETNHFQKETLHFQTEHFISDGIITFPNRNISFPNRNMSFSNKNMSFPNNKMSLKKLNT